MISCSTGSMTTVMTRNWIDHSAASGSEGHGAERPATEQLEAVGADGREQRAGQHERPFHC